MPDVPELRIGMLSPARITQAALIEPGGLVPETVVAAGAAALGRSRPS